MKSTLFCFVISFAICTYADNISNDTRCYLADSECQKNYFQTVGLDNAYTGIPALGVPVIDPFKVLNRTLSILGLLTVNFNGEAEGIGKCIVTNFETNVEQRYRKPEMVCPKIIIRGSYVLTPTPIAGKVCGWCNVHGQGNGTLVLENWSFKFKYPFKFLRRENGKIYLKAFFEDAEYKADVEKITLEANGVKMGKCDISNTINSFINQNWRPIMASYIGKFINDESAQYYYDIYSIFFNNVQADQYIKDDLTKLVDN